MNWDLIGRSGTMHVVKTGDDYEQVPITNMRLRELLQHERDNQKLRDQVMDLTRKIDVMGKLLESCEAQHESAGGKHDGGPR